MFSFPQLTLTTSHRYKDFDYVIMYGYQACHHKEDATAFAAAMRTVWVPFAMTEPSLMAAIFHVACRNYASITDNTNTTKFTLQKLQYRQMCLNMAMEAIASEEIATDATISLALLMASESVRRTSRRRTRTSQLTVTRSTLKGMLKPFVRTAEGSSRWSRAEVGSSH